MKQNYLTLLITYFWLIMNINTIKLFFHQEMHKEGNKKQ